MLSLPLIFLQIKHISRQKNFPPYSFQPCYSTHTHTYIYKKLIQRPNRWTILSGTLINYLIIFKVFLSLLCGLPFTQPKAKDNGPVIVFNYLCFNLPLKSGRWVLTYICSHKEQESEEDTISLSFSFFLLLPHHIEIIPAPLRQLTSI